MPYMVQALAKAELLIATIPLQWAALDIRGLNESGLWLYRH